MSKKDVNEKFDMKKAVKMLVVILIILALFYGLSLLITKSPSPQVEKKGSAEIQNREILLGSSFNRKDNEYLVVFYNKKVNTSLTEAIVNYRTKDKHLPTYEVDMGNGMNASHKSDVSNEYAESVEELQINGTTLIKFSKGKIVEYVEGDSEVTEYLK
ncbi:MAG: hypothetical protein IJH18_04590 [Bacilli bacterium]|nr:hypothetical protein [Bacilli bacterium]MBQ3469307.1 hypothetical protein [Bacilli bacterium]